MADRRISTILKGKGKVMSTYVTPACMYGKETLTLTELQQQWLKVCEDNWVLTNCKSNEGIQKKNGRGEETGVQRSLIERMVRSRLQWTGHVERMADNRLPTRAAELREEGRRRRGRPMLRSEM